MGLLLNLIKHRLQENPAYYSTTIVGYQYQKLCHSGEFVLNRLHSLNGNFLTLKIKHMGKVVCFLSKKVKRKNAQKTPSHPPQLTAWITHYNALRTFYTGLLIRPRI